MQYFKRFFIIIFVFVFSAVYCYRDVPVKEMSQAKSSVARAHEVKADKYSPDELKAAEDKLYQSHEFVRDNKIEEARGAVKESNTSAGKAIEKSLPPFSKDTLDEARNVYEKADLVYSEKFAPEDFATAGKTIGEAEELYNGKGYWESYKKSKAAIDLAGKARDNSLSHVDELQQEIKSMEDLSAAISGIEEFSRAGGGDIVLLNEKLTSARSHMDQENMKAAVPEINEAKAIINNNLVDVQKTVTKGMISRTKTDLLALNTPNVNGKFTGERDRADMLLRESEDLYNMGNYVKAYKRTGEAANILSAFSLQISQKEPSAVEKPVIIQKKSSIVMKEKAVPADYAFQDEAWDKLDESLDIMEAVNRYFLISKIKDDMISINTLLYASRKDYHSGKYGISLNKTVKAMKHIYKVCVILNREIAGILKSDNMKKKYTVQLIPGNNECLWSISDKFYNNPSLWPILYIFNASRMTDPDLINPGLVLDIPSFPEVVERFRKK